MTNTSVSILMPVYNGIEFLAESVLSVIKQTIDDWELLIAINGYSPNSEIYKITLKYIQIMDDSRIRVFDYHDCKGKPATLNKMLSECKYNYVALLDVDDIWLPNKLEAQIPLIMQNYDVIGTKCIYFGDTNNIIPNIPSGDIKDFNFLLFNPIINSSSIILKSLAHWDESCFVEDYDLWLKLWSEKRRFYNCDQVLVKHRIHNKSAFNSKGNHDHVDALRKKYAVV
jgi:teichuronic acid biosynthesis glycosyltransferase TuaG